MEIYIICSLVKAVIWEHVVMFNKLSHHVHYRGTRTVKELQLVVENLCHSCLRMKKLGRILTHLITAEHSWLSGIAAPLEELQNSNNKTWYIQRVGEFRACTDRWCYKTLFNLIRWQQRKCVFTQDMSKKVKESRSACNLEADKRIDRVNGFKSTAPF